MELNNTPIYIDVSEKSGYLRGVDWICFLTLVVLTIIVDQLHNQRNNVESARKRVPQDVFDRGITALLSLSEVCSLSLSYHVTIKSDIKKISD